jgi:DNA-binding NtrC family response regulator
MEISDMGPAGGLIVKCGKCPCDITQCCEIQRELEGYSQCLFSVSEFPCTAVTVPPQVAIICGCDADSVMSLRQRWDRSVLLGLFCPSASSSDVTQALRLGLDDFLCCPFDVRELEPRLCRLLDGSRRSRLEEQAESARKNFRSDFLLGQSTCFLNVLARLPRIARTDAICILYGETGTGKELLARAIHYASPRQGQPFVPLNCGAVPDQLFENELFGHAKGAFTNASSAQSGLIAVAEGGTLFLDEVDALSSSAQIKLLRFLQDREYRPLGSSRTLRGDVRIIVATNTCLPQKVEERSFREDLFHRLNVLSVTLPPLRERVEDILILAEHFLKKYALEHERDVDAIAPDANSKLLQYRWPGNVRELEGVMQRAIILASSTVLQACDIDVPERTANAGHDASNNTFQRAKDHALRSFERTYLTEALASTHGNVSRAAKAAGKERRSFQRLMQKHNLTGDDFRPRTA